jgi:hypothetical protein
MYVNIELSESDVKDIIRDYLETKLGNVEIKTQALDIQVKSKQNYKSEWETASFKCVYKHETK